MHTLHRCREGLVTFAHLAQSGLRSFGRFCRYAFRADCCNCREQYEGCITRLYHTLEKGLARPDCRPGFGRQNAEQLIYLMQQYAASYDTTAFFYRTALSVLYAYAQKNRELHAGAPALERLLDELPGSPNDQGGICCFAPPTQSALCGMNYEQLTRTRHSIRHFGTEKVSSEALTQALRLAQLTPSACNRQGWRTLIIETEDMKRIVLANQNGNRGFGEQLDKLLLITCDLRYFNRDRELHQPYIDGGMYAMSVLNSLYYHGIASIPLSAALTPAQEQNIRSALRLDDAEVLILLIGVGSYPDSCQTTRSARRDAVFRHI